jgi:hypothetical protein
MCDEHAERARRLEILQRAESEFDPIPFGAEAARIFGRVTAAVITGGRKQTVDWPTCSSRQRPSPRDCRCSRPTPVTSMAPFATRVGQVGIAASGSPTAHETIPDYAQRPAGIP